MWPISMAEKDGPKITNSGHSTGGSRGDGPANSPSGSTVNSEGRKGPLGSSELERPKGWEPTAPEVSRWPCF